MIKQTYRQIYTVNGLNGWSISSSYSVIVRVRVVLKRTVVDDCRFDNVWAKSSSESSEIVLVIGWCYNFFVQILRPTMKRKEPNVTSSFEIEILLT